MGQEPTTADRWIQDANAILDRVDRAETPAEVVAAVAEGLAAAATEGERCPFPIELVEELTATYPALRFFQSEHLPMALRVIAEPFARLAFVTARDRPFDEETSIALRKLLEAKDAAVRAEVIL